METLWGIILLIVMYIAIPVAIIAATLALLGGRKRGSEATEHSE
jgi:hypothetical protein